MEFAMKMKETDSQPFASDAERWAAVQRRDGDADGVFFYSVRTTGVYCRPSCASRLARRENVRFHASCEEAESAGFRPCKRCRPNEAALAVRRAAAVAKACRLIETAEEVPNLAALAASAGMSRFHFHRVFRTVTGLTPKPTPRLTARGACARRCAKLHGDRGDLRRRLQFERAFLRGVRTGAGMTPTRFRSGGSGAAIRFAVGECSLGSILVAATDKGVCSIMLGDKPEELVSELEDRFPKATLIGGDPGFERWVAKVVGFVEAPALGLDLPLDVRGTAFQQRVWQALRRIPPARLRPTRRSRSASACRKPCARWRTPAPPTRSPSPFPATASCATTARLRATAGASSASARCSSVKRGPESPWRYSPRAQRF